MLIPEDRDPRPRKKLKPKQEPEKPKVYLPVIAPKTSPEREDRNYPKDPTWGDFRTSPTVIDALLGRKPSLVYGRERYTQLWERWMVSTPSSAEAVKALLDDIGMNRPQPPIVLPYSPPPKPAPFTRRTLKDTGDPRGIEVSPNIFSPRPKPGMKLIESALNVFEYVDARGKFGVNSFGEKVWVMPEDPNRIVGPGEQKAIDANARLKAYNAQVRKDAKQLIADGGNPIAVKRLMDENLARNNANFNTTRGGLFGELFPTPAPANWPVSPYDPRDESTRTDREPPGLSTTRDPRPPGSSGLLDPLLYEIYKFLFPGTRAPVASSPMSDWAPHAQEARPFLPILFSGSSRLPAVSDDAEAIEAPRYRFGPPSWPAVQGPAPESSSQPGADPAQTRWLEEWQTTGRNSCPRCAALNGKMFWSDQGPQPALHDNCGCVRMAT